MKVWVYVEGESDKLSLAALWAGWRAKLGPVGWGIQMIPLTGKSRFLNNIGRHAAQKLYEYDSDLVVGLPDLYPNAPYQNAPSLKHADLPELKRVQQTLVKHALTDVFGVRKDKVDVLLERFHPTGLKHDLEMLLLAAQGQLRERLETEDVLGSWHHPVEDQNQQDPPKKVVERLFRAKRRQEYRDTVDAPAVLRKVNDMRTILFGDHGQIQCPVFKEMLDWIGTRTGVPAY
jgi:hypothetical protein